MKAIIREKGGKEFSTMRVKEIHSIMPRSEEVKIKMKSSRLNPVDMDLMKGFPTLKYKNPQIGGVDGAGKIIAIGESVKNFQVGDEVFFYRKFTDIGTWAQEITISIHDIALIPNNLTVEEAGSIALPLLTAYEGLISLNAKAGDSILVHGAGGGVGFQVVQLAQAMNLKIIANASERDQKKLRKVGISKILDYKKEDFFAVLKNDAPDHVFDVIGKETLLKSIKLRPRKVVSVAFPDTTKMIKTGVQLPWFFKLMMNLMNKKFVKIAQKNQVELIGQVTGANGKNLKAAARLVETINYLVPQPKTLALTEVAKNGLSAKDLAKVILF